MADDGDDADCAERARKAVVAVFGEDSVINPFFGIIYVWLWVGIVPMSLLFGPFATFSPKFLKNGRITDIVAQVRPGNLWPMLKVAIDNPSLITYLVGELMKNHKKKVESLRTFMPTAKDEDWELIQAGQRAQVMKKDADKGGVLQFGTEVVTSADGSIAGLLGASPGASTAASIMLGLLKTCFPDRIDAWEPELKSLIPSYGQTLNGRPDAARATLAETARVLDIDV